MVNKYGLPQGQIVGVIHRQVARQREARLRQITATLERRKEAAFEKAKARRLIRVYRYRLKAIRDNPSKNAVAMLTEIAADKTLPADIRVEASSLLLNFSEGNFDGGRKRRRKRNPASGAG